MRNLSKFLNESLIQSMPDDKFWKCLVDIKKKGPKYNGSICFYTKTEDAFKDIFNYFNGSKEEIVAFGKTFFDKAVELQEECDCETYSDDTAEYSAWTAVLYCFSERDFRKMIKGGEYASDDNGEIFGYALCDDEEIFDANKKEYGL